MRSESMIGTVRIAPVAVAQPEFDCNSEGGSGGKSGGNVDILKTSHNGAEDDLSMKVSVDEMGRNVDERVGQGVNDEHQNMAEIQLDSGVASPINSESNTVTKRIIFDINRNFQSKMSCDVGSSKSESVASSEESSGARHVQLAEEYNRLLMPILHMRRQSSNLYQGGARRRDSRSIDRGEDRDREYGRESSITPPGGRSARQSVTSDTSDDQANSPAKPSFWNRFKGWEKGSLLALATGGGAGQEIVHDDDIGSYHRDRNGAILSETETINDVEAALHPPHAVCSNNDLSNRVYNLSDVSAVVPPNMLKSFGYSKYGSMNTIEEENN